MPGKHKAKHVTVPAPAVESVASSDRCAAALLARGGSAERAGAADAAVAALALRQGARLFLYWAELALPSALLKVGEQLTATARCDATVTRRSTGPRVYLFWTELGLP